MNKRSIVLVGIVVAAALARLVPHPPNVTPIAAMALFGGACFVDRKMAYLLPLAAMLLSDLVLGYTRYGLWSMLAIQPVVYACILATTALGQLIDGSAFGVAGGRGDAGWVALVFRGDEFCHVGRGAPVSADGIGPGGLLRGGDSVLPQQLAGRRRLHRRSCSAGWRCWRIGWRGCATAPRRCRRSSRRSHARRFLAGQRHGDCRRPGRGRVARRPVARMRQPAVGGRRCRPARDRRSTFRCRAGRSTRKCGDG